MPYPPGGGTDVIARILCARSSLEQGGDPVGSTPEELDHVVKTELRKWAEVIRNAHIKVD